MRVISIIGWGRSGSTLLDRVLGSVPGAFSTGELRYLYERGVGEHGDCGCGAPVTTCDVWSAVLDPERHTLADAHATTRLIDRFARARHTRSLLRSSRERAQETTGLRDLVDRFGELYSAVEDVTGCDVIVDSSKWPSHAALLRLVPNVEPVYVHLVRDPRAVAYSWSRAKPGPDRDIPPCGTLFSSAKWVQWNLACEQITRAVGPERSVTIRYEDFVAAPRETVERIMLLAGHGEALGFGEANGEVVLPTAHTISGNPDRFVTGAVQIREDSRWLESLAPRRWAAATAVTAPLLRRYGYEWRAGAPWRQLVRGSPPLARRRAAT
jgi:hypothetical protein